MPDPTNTTGTGKEINILGKAAAFTEPTTSNEPPVTTAPAITMEDALKADAAAKADAKIANAEFNKVVTKSGDDVNPSMTNLIDMAERRNALMSVRAMDAHVAQVLIDNSSRVMQILKDHGMDTQQAEKAHKLLMSL